MARGMQLLIALALLVVVGGMSVFTVDQRELAVLLRLGEIQRSDFRPGLHFKIPLINEVRKFDGRLLNLDSEPSRFLTSEKKFLIVDNYVRWRIDDVERYFKATRGDERRAGILIAQKVNAALREEFGKRTVKQVVSGERGTIMEVVNKRADEQMHEVGIQVVDVRVSRIDLPEEVSQSVFQRMRAERERVARDFRSRGAEAAERIRAAADRDRTVLLAKAYKEAEALRGEGDGEAAAIYARAYDQDRDFYAFYRSLDAYRSSFGGDGNLFILEPTSQFLRYFRDPEAR